MTRRKYLDKRKESLVLAARLFHKHLDKCGQCREHPLDLCAEGRKALHTAVGHPPAPEFETKDGLAGMPGRIW